MGLAFPAGSRADIKRTGQEAEQASKSARGRARERASGSDGRVPGVHPFPRSVSRPREAFLLRRGSQIRGRAAKNQVRQPVGVQAGKCLLSPEQVARAARGGRAEAIDTSPILPGPSLAQDFSSARRTTKRGAGQDPQPGARAVATARPCPTRRDPQPRVPVWSRSLGGGDLGRSPPAGSRRLTPRAPAPAPASTSAFPR